MQALKAFVTDCPDFPAPGIVFRDMSPLLRHRFSEALAALEQLVPEDAWQHIDAVAGVDARGFILAAALASRRAKGFVPIRKQGKLPPPVVSVDYHLEYGSSALQLRAGQGRLLLVDDVLATGGTLTACASLIHRAGYTLAGALVLIDLGMVPKFRCGEVAVRSVIQYG